MKECLISLWADPFNGLRAVTHSVFLWNLETCSTGDRWPGSGLMKPNICATASNSWRNWHQIPNQRKMSNFFLLEILLGLRGRETWPFVWDFWAVSSLPGAILCSKLPSPWKYGQMAIVCRTGCSSKGRVCFRALHPRAPGTCCNTSQVPSSQWCPVRLCWMCSVGCMWLCFRVPQAGTL